MKEKIVCKNYKDIVDTISIGRFGKRYEQLFEVEKSVIRKIQVTEERPLIERMMGEW